MVYRVIIICCFTLFSFSCSKNKIEEPKAGEVISQQKLQSSVSANCAYSRFQEKEYKACIDRVTKYVKTECTKFNANKNLCAQFGLQSFSPKNSR